MATARERHREVYQNHDEDTRKRQRTVPFQIISAGFSRTGTMSLQAAYEILGVPTWHWVTMSANVPDLAMWTECLRSKYEPSSDNPPFTRHKFDNLLGYWGASTDQPASLMVEELLQTYPDAKVVLVERDVDQWYRSYDAAAIQGTESPFIPLASYIDRKWMGHMCAQMDLIAKYIFGVHVPRTRYALFNNPEYFRIWRANARHGYRKHNETIKRVTPKDRLLLFQLQDGWEPLCEFLGKEVPDVPFPRVNETKAIQEKVQLYIAESYRRSAVKFLKRMVPVVVAVLALWWLWRR
jgi:hypothetical protein